MRTDQPFRRRSAWWMREMSSQSLHRTAGRLYNKLRTDGVSAAEDATLDGLLSELEHRRRRAACPADQCTCMFCCGPFL